MAKSRDELAQEHEKAAQEAVREQREQSEKDAKEAESWAKGLDLETGAPGALSGEAAEEHLAAVRSTQIFGDTDTTAGASASGVDVPSTDNEAATTAVAAKDAAAELGDEEAAEVSDAEARRQVDVDAGTTASAEEVDEGAEEQVENDPARADVTDEDNTSSDAEVATTTDDDEENLSPQQKAARTRRARNRENAGE